MDSTIVSSCQSLWRDSAGRPREWHPRSLNRSGRGREACMSCTGLAESQTSTTVSSIVVHKVAVCLWFNQSTKTDVVIKQPKLRLPVKS